MLISFDIFDTAIFRDVYEPKDVFTLLGIPFSQKRIQAEQRANKLIRFPKLKDIYAFLPEYGMQKEINAEIEHCFANQKILDIYNEQENDYIFISDMYLPKTVLIQILENCGYKNPKVFVSCEYQANKSTGALFKRVQVELGRKIDFHYGDNYKADVLGAKLADIKPIYLPKIQDKNLKFPIVKHQMLKRYLAEIADKDCSDLQKLAIRFAIVLTTFTKWVIDNRKNKEQKIFFLSRDMYVPYLIARDYLKAENVHYLHASRKSLASTALKSKEKKLLDKMDIILSKEKQQEILDGNDYNETINYLKSKNITDNDFIVDIGYIGTIQKIIEIGLNIKLRGCYIQSDNNKFNCIMSFFTQRKSIISRALAEIVIGSPEKEIIGYKNCEPIFNKDSNIRKSISTKLTSWMLEEIPNILKLFRLQPITSYDCEQILLDSQTEVSDEILEFYNSTIFSDKTSNESPLKYDRNAIKEGKLLECYRESYSKPLFKEMLSRDKDFSHLIKYLPD